MNGNRIDSTSSVRMSTNVSVGRQTERSDFGNRVRNGLQTTAGLVAQGAAIVAPHVPGGAILSAAVSSVSTLSAQGGNAGAAASPYLSASTGVVGLGAGGGVNTTVPTGGGVGGLVAGGPSNVLSSAGGGASTGGLQSGVSSMGEELGKMLQVQMQMQRENQVFSTMSNVLKTRHDTVKNTISNVR